MKENITIIIDLGQVCTDILAKCNLISKGIQDSALADIKASIMTPDGAETKSIICRAITESQGFAKVALQRFLTTGRTLDDNNLERIAFYEDTTPSDPEDDSEEKTILYEKIIFPLWIENFNTAVTDALKSAIHKYIVDYTMGRFLQDLKPDKAAEYAGLADETDMQNIVKFANAREVYNMRKPSFI